MEYLIALGAFASAGCIFWGMVGEKKQKRLSMRINKAEIEEEQFSTLPINTAWQRISGPAIELIKAKLGPRFSKNTLEITEKRLIAAGRPYNLTAPDFQAIKILLAIVLAALVFIYSSLLSGLNLNLIFLMAITAFLGFNWPDMVLDKRLNARRMAITGDILNKLDILCMATGSAGMTIRQAIEVVALKTKGALATEFQILLNDLSKGMSSATALDSFAERCDTQEVKDLCRTLSLSLVYGSPIGNALFEMTAMIRNQLQENKKQKTAKAGINVFLPILFFILPAILILLLGPSFNRAENLF